MRDKTTKWTEDYKGFIIEVCLIERPVPEEVLEISSNFRTSWYTSYFIVLKRKVSPEVWEKILLFPVSSEHYKNAHFDYFTGITGDIEFHGGITYYDQLYSVELNEVYGIKLGCDYNHYWDENKEYNLEEIFQDIKNSVDSFLRLVV